MYVCLVIFIIISPIFIFLDLSFSDISFICKLADQRPFRRAVNIFYLRWNYDSDLVSIECYDLFPDFLKKGFIWLHTFVFEYRFRCIIGFPTSRWHKWWLSNKLCLLLFFVTCLYTISITTSNRCHGPCCRGSRIRKNPFLVT